MRGILLTLIDLWPDKVLQGLCDVLEKEEEKEE